MPLVSRRRVPFALEHVPQVPAAVAAHNFGARHAEGPVLAPRHGPGDAVKIRRPPAPRRELVRRLVQRRLAPRARVDARRRLVLVELARAGRLGALFAEDAELLGREDGAPLLGGALVGVFRHGGGGGVVGFGGEEGREEGDGGHGGLEGFGGWSVEGG